MNSRNVFWVSSLLLAFSPLVPVAPALALGGGGRAMLGAAAASRIGEGEMQRIRRGEIVFGVEDEGRGDRKIRFAGIVNGSPEAVYQVLSNFDIYDQVLPAYFTESKVQSRESRATVALFRFRTYWPFPDRHVVSRYQLDPERKMLAWWRVGGNVVKNDGTVVVRPYGQDRSLVDFHVAVDPGIPFVPHWIFEWAERQVVPGVITGIDGYLSQNRTASSR